MRHAILAIAAAVLITSTLTSRAEAQDTARRSTTRDTATSPQATTTPSPDAGDAADSSTATRESNPVLLSPEARIGARVALWAFGIAAALFILLLVFDLGYYERQVEFETRWGGFGGGLGGWRVSRPTVYLFSALLFVGLFASTVWVLVDASRPRADSSKSSGSGQPRDSAAVAKDSA